ncbi:MAG: acetyl-CoA carboxylase biotin carboxyl carrier protein subunit [Gemmatimonadota bacterium]
MDFFVHVDGNRYRVSVNDGKVLLDDHPVPISLSSPSMSPLRMAKDADRSLRVLPKRVGRGEWHIDVEGVRYEARVLDPGQEATRTAREVSGERRGPSPLTAAMPGLVVKVLVREGDHVEPGDGLLVVEAMKMENELRAGEAGRVSRVHVQEGSVVEKDAPLITFQLLEDDPSGGVPSDPEEVE